MTVYPHHYLENMPPFCCRVAASATVTPPSVHHLCEYRGPSRRFQQIPAPQTITAVRRRRRLRSPTPLGAAVPPPAHCRRRRCRCHCRHRRRAALTPDHHRHHRCFHSSCRRAVAAAVATAVARSCRAVSRCTHEKAKSETVRERMHCDLCVSCV